MDIDGWGVQFTNKNDSESVKAKICTFINNKPVSSYSYLFGLGSSSLIDFSDVNTSNVTDKVTNASSLNMFTSSTKLVGGAGTVYNSSYVNKTYAKIDGGTSSPGYFTLKSN